MPGLAIFLALSCAATWGVADFAGGLASRRLPAVTVTVYSQIAGFAALLVVFAARGGALDGRSLWIGLLGGIGGGAGLAAFYKALSLGTMSIVSPLVACGALVPFLLSIATGERPSALALTGAAVAIAGAVLASVDESRAGGAARAQAIVLAVCAAGALGLFAYFLGLGAREGDALSTLVGARVGSLGFLLVLAVGLRIPWRIERRPLAAVGAIGMLDVAANALFALASSRALLSLVAVLASLYPVVTVLLAHVVLSERLTRVQLAGIALAIGGVVALGVG